MSKLLRLTTFLAALLAVLPVAQAATHSYSFSGSMDSGVFDGSSFSGNFSFDDTTGEADSDWLDVLWYKVSSINFSFLDINYSKANAAPAPEVAFHNGELLGLSASFLAGDPQLTFVAAYPGSVEPAFLAYDTTVGFSGAGTVMYLPVPEPDPSSMLLAGLGLLGVLVSRRIKVS